MIARWKHVLWIGALVVLLPASMAFACSVCLCGDDLFFYTDQRISETGQLLFTLQEQYLSKTSGPTHATIDEGGAAPSAAAVMHGGSDFVALHEHHLNGRLTYGLAPWLTLSSEVPVGLRRLKVTTDDGVTTQQSSSGLGDIRTSAIVRHEFASSATYSYTLGVISSVKAPTGRNNEMAAGVRRDEHLQSGTGAWDFEEGIAIVRTAPKLSSYASAYWRIMGTNSFQYHHGNAFLYNVGGMYRVASRLGLTAEINGRNAWRDRKNGEPAPNSGGWVTYFTPGVRASLSPKADLTVNMQIPIQEHLFDDQNEGVVVVGGLGFNLFR